MIALDTSSLIAFLGGDQGRDVESVDSALELALPVLELHPGYWERAAATQAAVLARKLRARLADTLISQSCIDHRVPLITRDGDFAHFAKHAGLSLV